MSISGGGGRVFRAGRDVERCGDVREFVEGGGYG